MSKLPRTDPEFKALIPPLSPEEYALLEHNIATYRKCHDAIILWEGIIIDGHNRFEICVRHGIEFQVVSIPLESREAAKLWILENQLGRRNLTDAARIEIALLKAEMLREKAKKKQSDAGGDKKSEKYEGSLLPKVSKPGFESVYVQEATAAMAGVGKGTLCRYMQIKESNNPKLLEGVQSGRLKIGTAHRLLTQEILKQLTSAGKKLKFIKQAIPPGRNLSEYPDISNKLEQLAATCRNLIIKLEERMSTHDPAKNKPEV